MPRPSNAGVPGSQGQQDSRLWRTLTELGLSSVPGTFVEFGYRGASGSNTHALRQRGYSGVLFDGTFNVSATLARILATSSLGCQQPSMR